MSPWFTAFRSGIGQELCQYPPPSYSSKLGVSAPLGLVVDREESKEGKVAPGVVGAVEESERLLAVRGVDASVQIDRDAAYTRARAGKGRLIPGVGKLTMRPPTRGRTRGERLVLNLCLILT